ncbi:MAG: site-2 protease family protein, partial [Oscillospiraceae bacterium]|nr:site-2 protease family protein [Oscillospiraceae bacterium]
ALMQDWLDYCLKRGMEINGVLTHGEQLLRVVYSGCDMLTAIARPDGPMPVATLQTYLDEEGKEYRAYGFTYGGMIEATPLMKLRQSWYATIDYVRMVRLSMQMLFTGAAGTEDLSGPIGIVSTITQVGEEAEASGGVLAAFESIGYFAAMIAVNLAVMNLLPVPALDGGKVFFLLINSAALLLFKRQIPAKYENYIHGAGFALLMALMLYVTFNDVLKLI